MSRPPQADCYHALPVPTGKWKIMNCPTVPTIKRLFALSGNQCAFPRCPLSLVEESIGKVTGRICHIKARNVGGPRFDPNQTEEERHEFSNLLLLCSIHHDVIDSDPESYTVERLLEMKSKHEGTHIQIEEPSDATAQSLIMISVSQIGSDSMLVSQNQSGGQMAHQITNLLLQPNISTTFEREVKGKRDAHDIEIFRRSDSILDEETLNSGLDLVGGDHSYHESFYNSITKFSEFFERTQNQYMNRNLQVLSEELSNSLRQLRSSLATHFFVYPEHRNFEDTRYCLHPELNIDREGTGFPGDMATYDAFAEELTHIVSQVWDNFKTYRKALKESLLV
jgi:hypothetical protein